MYKSKFINVDGIKQFNINNETTNIIQNFYTKKPFPHYDNFESKQSIIDKGDSNKLTKSLKKFIGLNKNVLEVGAGTCQLSNYLAAGTNNNIFAYDPTFESLKVGKDYADNNGINNVNFVNADLFNRTFENEVFDIVWCSGVLHHTKDPRGGFEIISKYVKKNGYIIIGLYIHLN